MKSTKSACGNKVHTESLDSFSVRERERERERGKVASIKPKKCRKKKTQKMLRATIGQTKHFGRLIILKLYIGLVMY